MVVAPASIAASTQRHRKSCSVRDPSSADHSTSSVNLRASVTLSITFSRTRSGSICNLNFICRGLVEMKVWMRLFSAGSSASAARSMSPLAARASEQMVGPLICLAISLTDRKSPFDAMAKPASMMSTFISANACATRSFSSSVIDAPGDCSPSRRVVSKMMTRLSLALAITVIPDQAGLCPKFETSIWKECGPFGATCSPELR